MTTPRGRGRPRTDGTDNRAMILTSARELFSAKGFERTTIRGIAAHAKVDPALVHHYFGTKDNLLVEALRPNVDVAHVFSREGGMRGDSLGTEMVRRMVTLWEAQPEIRTQMIALLRISFAHESVAARVRDSHIALVAAVLGDSVVDDDRRGLRLALIGSQVVGLAVSRYILRVPEVADATPDEVARIVGPLIDGYLGNTV